MSDDDFLYGKSKNNSYIVFVIVVFGINNRVVNSGLTFQDHCKCHLRITQFAALFLTAIYTTRAFLPRPLCRVLARAHAI